jgi:4-methyl-5(b-hydroxyethyl)-thiazole monophosphate biosynthesis
MPRVLIPLAPGCEELEAVTLIDLLRRAEITVITASLTEQQQVTASRGVRLVADSTLRAVRNDDFDMLILPGGMPGAKNLDEEQRIHGVIQRLHAYNKAIAAICAAPMVLAHAGILDGKTITCYPGALSPNDWPTITFSKDPVVIDGNILTSQGPGTAIDFSLAIIEFLIDSNTKNKVEATLMRHV